MDRNSKSRFLRGTIFFVLSALAVGGCADSGQPSHVVVRDYFIQEPPRELDLLLVVDNTVRMEEPHRRLAEGLPFLVDSWEDNYVDYHIATTTTDMGRGGHMGQLVGDPKVITRNTKDADTAFSDMVNVGTWGGGEGSESGLLAAQTALSLLSRADSETDFYRSDAVLEVLFLSNEDDSSVGPVSDFLAWFYDLKGQRRRDDFRSSALAGINPATMVATSCEMYPGQEDFGPDDTPRYLAVAQESGGVVGSICEETYSAVLGSLSQGALRLAHRFQLSQSPASSTTSVELSLPNGENRWIELLPEGLVDGEFAWTILSESRGALWLVFLDAANPPPFGSEILVTRSWFP